MAYRTKIFPIVRHDLDAAKKWYSGRKEELGEDVKREVNKAIDSIGKSPLQYQRKYKEFRQSMVRRFPYSIFFVVEEEKNQITILEFYTVVEILRLFEDDRNRRNGRFKISLFLWKSLTSWLSMPKAV